MRISIVLILVVTAVNVKGRPHNDGTDHTHSPVIAPDSESVISIEGHNEAAVHHSDVGLGNFTRSDQTDMSHIAPAQSEIAAAETHHSDTYMASNSHVTSNPKPLVGTGHAPIIHVDNSGKNGDHLTLEGKIGSVVSHGPMAKNIDNHEVKHNHDHDHEHIRHSHHDKHSTVNHAPMATEHHPKTVNAHHPQLSKTEPAIAHAPLAHPDENHKTDRTDDAINEHSAVTSTVNHPPLATDHHPPKTMLAHHPSLSKSDPPLAHAPIAIPHGNEKSEETGTRKKRSGPGGLSTHPKTPPRESIEEYQDSEESEYQSKEEQSNPSKQLLTKYEQAREKRSKGSNQKSYARKTTTTTTTTTVATPTESESTASTERDSSGEHGSKEEKSEGSEVREKRSKGSNQKNSVKRLTTSTTTATTTTTTTQPLAPTAKEVFEASHRGSSEEQDSREQLNKKPEESEFREKRSKGSNRKPAAYTRTTITTTTAPVTKHPLEATSSGSSEDLNSHGYNKDEGESKETQAREKRSKGSNQKSYARKTTTSTTTTTVAPATQDSSNPTSLESSEDPEIHIHDKSEETEVRSKRSKGSNHSFAKKPLTTHNYPTVTSTTSNSLIMQEATEVTATGSSDAPEGGEQKSDDIIVRAKRSKGNYQKTQPRKTTTTTTTAKPTTSAPTTLGVSEYVSVESSESSSSGYLEVTSEKSIREKRSKGSNQNSYAKKHQITTTLAPKAPEPEVPASNVHHPSLSKTEPLNPAKPEEPIRITKPEVGNPATVPESIGKPAQPPQIIPGSHPLAIPLPTNPPPS